MFSSLLIISFREYMGSGVKSLKVEYRLEHNKCKDEYRGRELP